MPDLSCPNGVMQVSTGLFFSARDGESVRRLLNSREGRRISDYVPLARYVPIVRPGVIIRDFVHTHPGQFEPRTQGGTTPGRDFDNVLNLFSAGIIALQSLRITRPDDWHVHFRDGEALRDVVPDTARRFARAIVMPNLDPPVTTVAQALSYRERILAAVPEGMNFTPLMTLYLTDETSAEEIARAKQCGHVYAVKLYPAGVTTNSAYGVTDLKHASSALAAMEEVELPLLVHGEVVEADVDVFDRERVFIERVLADLVERYAHLKIVFEHVTTSQAVEFVESAPDTVAATITAHHLLLNRNAMFAGGIRPHHYCLPVLKREVHRAALIQAATGGSARYFLGTDSAPHSKAAKENACGCAGMYTAHAGLELYAEAFEQAGMLDRLEAFASFNGPDFYGLPRNKDQIEMHKSPREIPATLPFGGEAVVPYRAGERVTWSLAA